ncbi:hypothetical protein MKX08_007885 [Trichoderma sp. CBMAI-0020]|nr:hypothetical protein MKX08_007885 [Trichoderma sp. CBMAI-0020]
MACADLKPPSSEHYGVNEGADAPETRTDDLFSQDGDSPPPAPGERQLGLDVLLPLDRSGSTKSNYDVVTVHGIRDDYKTAWTDEDGTLWLKNRLFERLSIRKVDYSYEIDEEATIFQAGGIKLHAEKLLMAYATDRASLEEAEINRPIIWICHDLGGTIVKERRAEGDDGIPEVHEQEDIPDPVTPFSLYAHTIGHSFEGSRRIRINYTNHVDLIRGGNWNEGWIERVSDMFIKEGCGLGQSNEERAAKVNSALAEVCLRYLQFGNPQDAIMDTCSKIIEGNDWKTPIDVVVISQSRASMADYAVRFWPLHYEASGQFKPKQLLFQLFANKKARCCWETFAWLLSNPFTRSDRSYISTLPRFAKLGLHDLIDEYVRSETHQSTFNKNCWFAITEAARAGRSDTVRKLLQHVSVDEEELQRALLLGAGNGNEDTLSMLVEMIPRLEAFQWSKHLLHRASAIGLGSLLTLMLRSGYDINELRGLYQWPPVILAVWRNCVSSVNILLKSDFKADLSIKHESGDTLLACAVRKGNPRVIEMILKADGNAADTNGAGSTLTQVAVYSYMHKAAELLIKAGADGENGHNKRLEPSLIIAAKIGALECARILLKYGADPLASCATGTALYEAVANKHIEIARLLLEQEQKPDLDAHPPKEKTLLLRAIDAGNADFVSMLIDYGIDIEFVDQNGGFNNTPLSYVCEKGDLDIVKCLLGKNVDINYTGGVSASPLFTTILHGKDEVATYLLQNERIDIHWARADGVNALIAAYRSPETARELLKRGVSIDHCSSGGTILHMAAPYWPKTIRALLEHDPKPNLESVCGNDMEFESDIGCTPLQLACQNQAPECVELLIDAGANARFRNKKGVDAVDILLQTNSYTKDFEQCLRLILSQPGQFDPGDVNAKGQTRLHMITRRTPLAIVQLLVKVKVPLDSSDKDGYTPLAISIREGNTKVTKYLIDQGVSANVFAPNYGSILHLAVIKGAVELVKRLIDLGSDCEAVDPKYGDSLLYTALEIKDSSELQEMVKYLVGEVKVPIDKLGGEFSYPIIKAADMTRTNYTIGIKMLKFLIRRKAQLNVMDSQGRRAVHLACISHHAGGIKLLVEAGAEVDVKDKFSRMPLHFAASSPSNSCFEYLLETQKQMDINLADNDGWTPHFYGQRDLAMLAPLLD